MKMNRNARSLIMLVASVPLLGACASRGLESPGVVGAAAADDGGNAYNVTQSVATVQAAVEATFAELGITVTGREVEDVGVDVEIQGTMGEQAVEVDIEREGSANVTNIEVVAMKGGQHERNVEKAVMDAILRRLR